MPLTYATLPGDIDHLIADDHAVVERQFQHLEAGRGDRRTLVDQIGFELALHADAEERTLYPAMAKAGMEVDSDAAREEHREAKELLVVLNRSEPGEPEFEEALTKLIAAIREHVGEEESVLLPRFREAVGAEELADLGGKFLHAKRSAPTYAHPLAPSSATGHKLADAGAVLVDKVRDRLSGRRSRLATDPSGYLDPQAQALADALSELKPLPQEVLTPKLARKQPGPDDALRKALENAGLSTDPEPVGSVNDIMIPGPASELKVRVYVPAGDLSVPRPVLLWIHGGGWVLFDIDTYDASCRGMCNKLDAIVISPDYRRAPEDVFPASHDDVLATYRWIQQSIISYGGDPSRIGIGGESVGATMAAATCLQLAEAGEQLPLAQVLVYPLTTGEQFGPSMADAADARPLNRPLLSWMAKHAFEGVPEGAQDPRVDLLSVPAEQLAALPPTLVITDERDVLRSQGEEFAAHLKDAGVNVETLYYEGVMHEFFGASALLDKAEQAQQQAAAHLSRHGLAPQQAA